MFESQLHAVRWSNESWLKSGNLAFDNLVQRNCWGQLLWLSPHKWKWTCFRDHVKDTHNEGKLRKRKKSFAHSESRTHDHYILMRVVHCSATTMVHNRQSYFLSSWLCPWRFDPTLEGTITVFIAALYWCTFTALVITQQFSFDCFVLAQISTDSNKLFNCVLVLCSLLWNMLRLLMKQIFLGYCSNAVLLFRWITLRF